MPRFLGAKSWNSQIKSVSLRGEISINYKTMKLKYQFHFQPVGKIYMGVAVGESARNFHGMLQLNEMGYDIVSLMVKEISRDEIVERLLQVYEPNREKIEEYVDNVVKYLKAQEVLI